MKRRNKSVSLLSAIAVLLCILPLSGTATVSAEKPVSPYVNIESVPDNIKKLLDIDETASANTLPSKAYSLSASEPSKILDTDELNSIRMEDEKGNGIAKVFGVPVRYKNSKGETRFIDTSMSEENWLSALTGGYEYRNTANDISIRFSKKPDKGIRLDNNFTMAVYNPEKRKLPKGYLAQTDDGSGRMVYPEAFGEHTYVEYINTYTGVKENTVLEKNVGKNRFDFVFESNKHIPVLSEDRKTIQIVHMDNPEEVIYSFASLYVYDSYKIPESQLEEVEKKPSKEPMMYGPAADGSNIQEESAALENEQPNAQRHFSEDGYYEVTKLNKKKYRITAVVSEEFLKNPDTVYPVTIDPSFGANNSNAQDSYVWQNNGGKVTDYGSLDYIRFGRRSGGDMIGYFRFSQLPSLPANINITDATLKFNFRPGQTTGANGICYIVTSKQWDEGSLTWNNQPFGSWGYGSTTNNFQYYNFYVKPFVDMWYTGTPNYGVDFTYENMINDYNSVVSSEGDAARAPTLTITYNFTPSLSPDSGLYFYLRNANGVYLSSSMIGSNYVPAPKKGIFCLDNGDYSDYFRIIPYNTDPYHCFDVKNAWDTDNNDIQTFVYNPSYPQAQNFRFISNGRGAYFIMPKLSTTRVLTVDGEYSSAKLRIRASDTDPNQLKQIWFLEPAGCVGIQSGQEYYLKNVSNKRYLDIDHGLDEDLRNAITYYSYKGNINQKFRVEMNANGTYKLVAKCSSAGRVLDVTGDNVDIYTDNGADYEQFIFLRDNTKGSRAGCFYIKSVSNGKYVTATNNDNNVATSTSKNDSSLWSLEKVPKGSATVYNEMPLIFSNSAFTDAAKKMGYSASVLGNQSSEASALSNLRSNNLVVYAGHSAEGILGFNGDLTIDTSDIQNSVPFNGFANTSCFISFGCRAASYDVNGENVLLSIYASGAKFVLGFINDVNVAAGNSYMQTFFNAASQGKTIEECMRQSAFFESSSSVAGIPAVTGPKKYKGDIHQTIN